jgi:molybdenum cofactor cytidylyltransferase
MTAGIILAAGNSTRMGSPKALLPDPDGRPFVARLTRTFSEAGVAEIYIVTGSQHDAIVAAVVADRPTAYPSFLNNPKPDRGQLSSLWIGLDAAVRPEIDAILVTPVDIPMVHASTIRQIVEVWQRQRAPVVRPAVGVRHGHPVLFDRSLFDELRKAPLDQGARAVVHAHADRIVNVPVEDEGCLVDVDTPADYDALMRDAT